MSEVRPATTVLLLRPLRQTTEIFLVKRHGKSAFMPSAWVFPGGRVDPGDGAIGAPFVTGGAATAARLHLEGEEGRAYLVAGVRETFEEAGIWLGVRPPSPSLRQPLAKGELRFADVLRDHGSHIDLDRLLPWSWWVTPDNEPRRYDTRFVLCTTEEDGAHDEHETVDSGWYTPAEALAAVREGEMHMAPPTWWTLTELSQLGSLDAILAASKTREIARIQPLLSMRGAGALELTLPGNPKHPDPAIDGLPTEIRFEQGRWWAT